MQEAEFSRYKSRSKVTPQGLYNPGNPFTDRRGIVRLDNGIEDLVLDINRLPFAFTGPTCQGHFHLYFTPEKGVEEKVDFNSEGIPIVADCQPEITIQKSFYWKKQEEFLFGYYKFHNLSLWINDEHQGGRELRQEVSAWVRSREGRAFLSGKEDQIIVMVPEEVYEHPEKRYTLDEAREINRIRLEGISSFYQVIKRLLERYPPPEKEEGAPNDPEDNTQNLVLQRQGRIPEGMTQKNDPIGYECKTQPIKLDIAVTPLHNGKMIVHIPGFLETANGYGNKYQTLANLLQQKGLAAMVRTDNRERDYHRLEETLFDDLRFVIDYALKNAKDICGTDNPELYFMSFSGGANALGVLAPEYPQVRKMLMMGPAIECDSPIKDKFSQYTGELYIVQGEGDWVLNGQGGKIFHRLASNATRKELVMIPNCDHFFKHKDEIYSKAPFWAFAGDTTFPNPEGGIKLVRK